MKHVAAAMMIAMAAGLAVPGTAGAVDVHDTLMLADPTVSAEHVVFVYADDLWVVDRDGGTARRLTTHPGRESDPHLSPDGRLIAFSGHYDGNRDVYVMPVEGGEPTRLTWHPGEDIVRGFTPDGSAVLFVSARESHTRRFGQLFTIPVDGGWPERLPLPSYFKGSYSPDGRFIAYNPLPEAFRQWKNYRGGTASRIWIYDSADHSVVQVPQPEGRCNDVAVGWMGEDVVFLSDRHGEFNLYAYDRAVGDIGRLTAHEDFPIQAAQVGGGVAVYEQAGALNLFDPQAGASTRLRIGVAADFMETRPRWVSGDEFIRSASLSPSGARAAFDFRGEIVTVPAAKGDPRVVTNTPGTHERSPSWSPDGTSIAYFSDASGEVALHIAPQDGRGEVEVHALEGSGFYDDLKWSPDGTRLSYSDNSWTLWLLDRATGRQTKIASEVVYGPVRTQHHSWSPDSSWLVYTRNTPTYLQQLWLYSVADDASFEVTDGLSDVGEPCFDAGGEVLWFKASTDAGPVRSWFAMSNADMEMTGSLYVAVLAADGANPLAAESDEETGRADEDEDKGDGEASEADGDGAPEVRIDLEGLAQRIVAVPLPAAEYTGLASGKAGTLHYVKRADGRGLFGDDGAGSLCRFDLDSREESCMLDGVDGFVLSGDGKKVLVAANGAWTVADAGSEIGDDADRLDTGAIQVRIDPRAEWAQIFDEAWRINRDFFYDPNMHGADWPAMKARYEPFLEHLASRDDLNRLIRWMCSELAVGHHRVGGGDGLAEPEEVPGGLLGADIEIADGRYRFARVFGGLNWNPELRAPLSEPGVGVEAGEYLLAVDGRDLAPPENLYSRFENTAGAIVELTVGPNPDGSGSRTVQVVPVDDESALRNRAWVEGNLEYVTRATDGRVAYVYVPNTTGLGHTYFKRYFFPQADRQAIIVDERYNGGGQVADYYIDLLRRPELCRWTMRYGADIKTPLSSIQGPKVMLIDENAGSGGDLLPWMFSELELGTLIGRPTWGGLVGTLGFPVLMDGGRVTAPNLAIWTSDGFIVENVGVSPDIEVEMLPAEVIAGRDPQLDKAIEVVLAELEANPPVEPTRPPHPVRVRHRE
ncbi:MAG TPA: PDZ domain-containing protein [Candidatus Sulfomarinibacteraceae bacterium]|nr:PDZ domain-containing protein [Candidatus Sulfomarinibacteraceae bacterium]